MRYLTPEELKSSGRAEAREILERCAGKNVKYDFAFKVFSKYSRELALGKDAAVLDIGTASGSFLKQIRQNGYTNLYGHDIDDYIPPENKKLLKDYKLCDLGAEKLPWPDNFFDVITAWCVLPHLENPFYASRELRRVLKPDGIFVFTTPHITSRPSIDFFLKKGYFASYRPTNNHIALLPKSVLEKTIFRGFDHIGTEYLVTPKIFKGLKGRIRKAMTVIAGQNEDWARKLADRWAYNICYIIRKQNPE